MKLPDEVRDDLLRRWREPRRHYHSESHLRLGLLSLEELGGTDLDRIAFWCHDAVHSNTTPDDEIASAALARTLLTPYLTPDEVDEVERLVLITIGHQPEPGDESGARIADADLASLAFSWPHYFSNTFAVRAEMPHLDDESWRAGRSKVLTELLSHEQLYHTSVGRERWEAAARENIRRELRALEA